MMPEEVGMLRWTLLPVVFLAFAGCGSDEDVKEPGEKVVAGGREKRPEAVPDRPAAPESEPEAVPDRPAGEPITDPDDLHRDKELEIAVEVGLHEVDTPPPEVEKVVIELDDRGRIVGSVPDTAPEVGYLFATDTFVCPEDSVIQGARPPKGREIGCRLGGMLVGPFIEWYDNGRRRVEKQYVDGVKQGPARQWYRDGSLQAVRYFRRSRPHGRYARWHVNSRIAEKGEYEDGKEVGPWTAWYPNSRMESEGMYVLGRKEGPWTYWHPNGQKKKEGRYASGQKTGAWAFWYDNGQTKKKGEFVNDYPAHRLRIFAEDGSILQ